MKKCWKNDEAYQRILEILDDYWVTEPDEFYVRVSMCFVKANGENQEKTIRWINPNIPMEEMPDVARELLMGDG